MKKVIESLTKEQETQLSVCRDKWIRIGLCTLPADREKAAAYMIESDSVVISVGSSDHPVKGLRNAKLLLRDVADDEPILIIDCLNSTPEPDGTVKHYYIRIDPKAYNGRAGKEIHAAMASTWRNADGSLFFEKPEQYCPEIET